MTNEMLKMSAIQEVSGVENEDAQLSGTTDRSPYLKGSRLRSAGSFKRTNSYVTGN